MELAADHFEQQTGRPFYGLAGYHYSVPEWGFKYHPGGQHIERLVVSTPSVAIFILLLISLIAFIVRPTSSSRTVFIGLIAYHIAWALAFAALAGWYDINIMGVFI